MVNSPRRPVAVALAFLLSMAGGCRGGVAEPTPTPRPNPSPTEQTEGTAPPVPTHSGGLSRAELRYRLIDELGAPAFCDPDFYPVARDDEAALAEEAFPRIAADTATLDAILARLSLDDAGELTSDQKLAVYREYKSLNAVELAEVDEGRHNFRLRAGTGDDPEGGSTTQYEGTIGMSGEIDVDSEVDAGPLNCPICLTHGSLIDTPAGPIPVERLRPGAPVWSQGDDGRRIATTVQDIASTPAPPGHRVVHLLLDDGRELTASPGHPLADGRTLAELAVGHVVDGARVVSAMRIPYAGDATYDLLPSGGTGIYWVAGIALRTTLGAWNR